MALTGLDTQSGFATRQNYIKPTCPVSGVNVKFRGDDFDEVQTVELDIGGQALTLTKSSATGYNATKILDFPAGHVTILSAYISGGVTTGANSGATEALLCSLGSTATADATLSSYDVDILPSTSTTMAARVGTIRAGMVTGTGTPRFDGTSSALDVYLNLAQAANVTTADTSATFSSGAKICISYIINVV